MAAFRHPCTESISSYMVIYSRTRYYTDAWGAFSEVPPPDRHVVGKAHTVSIERDNSNTRHHLDRFTRRTKVVSKKAEMVDVSLKLWRGLTDHAIFGQFQKIALSIYQ